MSAHSPEDLKRIYEARFRATADYRRAVWSVLISQCFQTLVPRQGVVLDLGCGYGEFINQIECGSRLAMDLNPDAPNRLRADVKCFLQDCSTRWPMEDNSLDVVFTSNFFEHLPDKAALGRTLDEAYRCLKPRGRLVAMGPNIKYLPGPYWDFWDHYLPLTDLSLREALMNRTFKIERCEPRFLPYTTSGNPRYPLFVVHAYVAFPPIWRIFGKQFLVVASK
ncbi:MAG TPA: class I SAM-dependent methyltransferase [Candidatus Dormibacteraeota bacterium]|nr:class I SAM-dependent methyltransferase [Candidatus Dormibacteraeota bacterium]